MSRLEQMRIRLIAVLLSISVWDIRPFALRRLITFFNAVCPNGLNPICLEDILSEILLVRQIIFEKHQTSASTPDVDDLRERMVRDLWSMFFKNMPIYSSERLKDRRTEEGKENQNRADIVIYDFQDLIPENSEPPQD